MTTKVSVVPSGHRVQVTITDQFEGGEPNTSVVVHEASDPPVDYYATDTRTIAVVDLPPEPVTPVDPELDL